MARRRRLGSILNRQVYTGTAALFLSAIFGGAQQPLHLAANHIEFTVNPLGTKFGFRVDGKDVVRPDAQAGLLLAGSPVSLDKTSHCSGSSCALQGRSAVGKRLTLLVRIQPHTVILKAEPEEDGLEVRFVTGGAAPAYGLADHAAEKRFSTLKPQQFNTDVSGFTDDEFLSGQGLTRLVSNFAIYPRQRFAELLIDPHKKIVHTSAAQIVQGVTQNHGAATLYYFFGDPHEIYKAYLDARNAAGYRVFTPKYRAFGVGWEAFGALGWDTNQKTDTASIDRYLSLGYPLKWVVIGSGFWPSQPDSMHETTSFGLWDRAKYPDPTGMIAHFSSENLTTMLGLRITFITTGPYSQEGAAKGYFLKDKEGKAQAFTGGWPKLPYYLLDSHNPAALHWYMALVKKWQGYGVAGWKEDFYGYGKYDLRDDKVDPVNDRLMMQHQLLIERNGYLSSNGDLHRINDFNYNQDQDRGPVNALALAYAGFPLVYPDIVGGTFGENHFATTRTPQMETYMMRNVQWAALHSSMGMGEPPWSFSPRTAAVMLKAAKFHARIAPYLFSNARRFATDGYPWTMTPLPIAFPDDPQVYGREDATHRGYEWLIGDAMLAAPLYGNDYATATTRDVYLPAGRWMDYETGRIYEGRQLRKNLPIPPDKIPLFIGGSGVTLEEINGKILVCIYPLRQSGTSVLTLPENPQAVTVHIAGGLTDVHQPVSIKNRAGMPVAYSVTANAVAFAPRAGESYTITAGK
jgi:alpha-glucosidase (family GH31 glycosyl hydrolase)